MSLFDEKNRFIRRRIQNEKVSAAVIRWFAAFYSGWNRGFDTVTVIAQPGGHLANYADIADAKEWMLKVYGIEVHFDRGEKKNGRFCKSENGKQVQHVHMNLA